LAEEFDRELDSWEGFLSGLRKPDSILFKEMLEGTRQYKNASKLKDGIPTETLLMILLLERQKMINQLLEKYSK
jgi:hypothetical protein